MSDNSCFYFGCPGHFWGQKIFSFLKNTKTNMENQTREKDLMKDYGKYKTTLTSALVRHW